MSEVYNRKHPRIDLKLRAFFQIQPQGKFGKQIPLVIKTIGKGGLMFVSPIPLSIGKELSMRLRYYSRSIEFTVKGVWLEKIQKNKNSMFRSGAVFTEISDENMDHINQILNIHRGYYNPSA
ncbi:MAG: PilZ domain-containing protein [Nitrospiria bacterium]